MIASLSRAIITAYLQIHESSEAKDLVQRILQVDPDRRPSIDEILSHPWCKADVGVLSSRSLLQSLGSMYQLQLASSMTSPAADRGSVIDPLNIESKTDFAELCVLDDDSIIII